MTGPAGDVLVIVPAKDEAATIAGVSRAGRRGLRRAGRRRRLDRRHRVPPPAPERRRPPLPFNLGVGGALRCGFRYAVDRGYRHRRPVRCRWTAPPRPDQRPAPCQLQEHGAHLVIGSRFGDHADYRCHGRRAVMKLLSGMVRPRPACASPTRRRASAASPDRCWRSSPPRTRRSTWATPSKQPWWRPAPATGWSRCRCRCNSGRRRASAPHLGRRHPCPAGRARHRLRPRLPHPPLSRPSRRRRRSARRRRGPTRPGRRAGRAPPGPAPSGRAPVRPGGPIGRWARTIRFGRAVAADASSPWRRPEASSS